MAWLLNSEVKERRPSGRQAKVKSRKGQKAARNRGLFDFGAASTRSCGDEIGRSVRVRCRKSRFQSGAASLAAFLVFSPPDAGILPKRRVVSAFRPATANGFSKEAGSLLLPWAGRGRLRGAASTNAFPCSQTIAPLATAASHRGPTSAYPRRKLRMSQRFMLASGPADKATERNVRGWDWD